MLFRLVWCVKMDREMSETNRHEKCKNISLISSRVGDFGMNIENNGVLVRGR